INAPVFTENVLSFPVVYGLCLQGLKRARLQTNLLPQDIQVERLVRAKKPWAVTAAAAILLGISALTFGYYMPFRAVASEEVIGARKVGDGAIAKATDQQKKYDNKKKEIEKNERAVKSILAGQDERLDWIALNKYINDCLPRVGFVELNGKLVPNPEAADPRLRLTQKQADTYWNATALAAHQKFLEREGGLSGVEGKVEEDEGVDELIQINAEVVDCLYTDTLEEFFNKMKADAQGKRLDGMLDQDKSAPPTGPGWVIEVRGYTYHKAN